MAKITYVEFDGTRHTVEVASGQSVMEGAVKNNVPGIDGDCGGACACATCHAYVDADWTNRLSAPLEMEKCMLELAQDVGPHSRLTCQIPVTDALDGLLVRLPERQH